MELFLSAVLGGIAGYFASRWQSSAEARERKTALADFVWNELARIEPQLSPYDPDTAYSMDLVTSVGADRLLDGETLFFREDAHLLAALLDFRVAVTKYNSLVQATNGAMAGAPLPDHVHGGMYDAISGRRRDLVGSRDAVLLLLPPRTDLGVRLSPGLDQLAQISRQPRNQGHRAQVTYQGGG